MVRTCADSVPPKVNPGVELGAVLGTLGRTGRDKVTIFASPGIADLGAWLEQLLAESTGKKRKGLIPVDLEPLVDPDDYNQDRIFVYLRLESAPDAGQDRHADGLESAGQPLVRIRVTEPMQIGQEFFRWEIATAVAGAIIGIDPFDQPDVEASKVRTRALMEEYEKTGQFPAETPIVESDGIRLFADKANADALRDASGSVATALAAHLARLHPGDYCALLAYIERDAAHQDALTEIRRMILEKQRVATCLGFGPRFLHSTGQAYKGGPGSGVFLQITNDEAEDLPVPGRSYTFGLVKAAQARGDFEVLAERGRRALRVHLGPDVSAGLAQLRNLVRDALA
jgi:transaldolase/glucose-6-phosphate isomerase